ncbi:MAG: DUF998 domain-containing protein [Bacteroidota bacterium]
MKFSKQHILYFGIISPLVFWLTTILCGILLEDYNHLTYLVSELGAQGTRSQYLFSIGLVTSSILNGFFVYALWGKCKEHEASIVPLILMFCYSFLAGPGIIPMPLPLHGIIGLPFPLIMFAPLFALIFWKRNVLNTALNAGALISLLIMLMGFLIYFPDILPEFFGLKQRFLYLGWTVWSSASAVRFIHLDANSNA